MITKAGKVMTKKFLFISSFFYLAAAALPMTEARAADPDTDPVNITCPGGSCDNQTIDNNGEMTVNAEGVAKENTIGDTGKMTVNDGGIAQKTTVNSGGSVQINEGGSAIETTINGGLMNVAETGTAEGVTIDSGALLSGGYVSEAVVNSGGATIDSNSYKGFEVYGNGVSDDATVNTGGYMLIRDGGTANGTVIAPMPLPDLGKNDVKVDLTKENEYGQNSVLEDTITYYEGNGVSYTSTGEFSGGGVAYWTNADKSGIDLSKYKSIRIVASSDTANTPVVCELLKSNPANVWGGGIDVFDGYSEYNAITEAGKAQVFEFQISDDLAADLAEGTLAYGIRLKYNAYHTDGDDLPNCNFNIYSIILMGKDDVPEPTATPTEEPTPTPGVASGSAAVVVTATGSAAGLDLEEGDTLDLNASVSTTGCAVTGDIVWTSSNEEVATVSASGASATVTAVGEGTATIKATITTDTGIVTYDKYDVTVVASDLVLEGDDLGAGASYTYVPNGFALYASMGIFEIDKSKLSKEGTTISIKYTAMEGDTDVKDTQRFNIGLKTGDKWNSPAIKDYYGKTGGEVNLTLTADDMKKIGADDKVYVHVGTGTAGFKGTFTYLSVTAGEDSLVSELPKAVSYVESGLAQWAPTAKVMLPSDIDFKQYSKCQIEFTASDPTFEFHGIVGHKVNGKDVTDPKYGVTSEGYFEVNLSNVKKEEGTEPFVVINAGKAGYAGSVTITKITFVK